MRMQMRCSFGRTRSTFIAAHTVTQGRRKSNRYPICRASFRARQLAEVPWTQLIGMANSVTINPVPPIPSDVQLPHRACLGSMLRVSNQSSGIEECARKMAWAVIGSTPAIHWTTNNASSACHQVLTLQEIRLLAQDFGKFRFKRILFFSHLCHVPSRSGRRTGSSQGGWGGA